MEKIPQSSPPLSLSLPPPQMGVEIYVWMKVLTAIIVFGTAVLSFYIAWKKCRSNNNAADPGLELQGHNFGNNLV